LGHGQSAFWKPRAERVIFAFCFVLFRFVSFRFVLSFVSEAKHLLELQTAAIAAERGMHTKVKGRAESSIRPIADPDMTKIYAEHSSRPMKGRKKKSHA
jgi:hypothetical protein